MYDTKQKEVKQKYIKYLINKKIKKYLYKKRVFTQKFPNMCILKNP